MKKKKQLLLVLAVGLLAGPMVAQADFEFELVDHPGAPDTQVFGINDRGDVVGNGITNVAALPFVFAAKKGTFTDVPPLAGFARTAVLGTNDSGVLVGSVISVDETTRSGFIRDKKGNFTVLDHPAGVGFTQFRGVNNKGLVTGFRGDASVIFVGFIYDPKSDAFTDLIPTGFFTIAQGINSKGEVVGSTTFLAADDPCPSLTNPFHRFGWLRATDGTVTYFEVNGSHTSARGINDHGSIAGFFFDLNDGKFKGFKVTLDGSQCQSITVAAGDVLEIDGLDNVFAGSINNSGVIAGAADDNINSHGFIARPE